MDTMRNQFVAGSILLTVLFFSLSGRAQKEVRLYDGMAPGSEDWDWSEQAATGNPNTTDIIYNVTDPTLTVYLPPEGAANGTGVVVAPGGAFHILSMQNEGRDVARWLNSKGVAAFVLKYRLAPMQTNDPMAELTQKMQDFEALDRENEPYIELALADGLKALDYVHRNADSLRVYPDRIGFMGFSAGGTLTMSVVYNATEANRPDFVAPVYAYEPAIIGSQVPGPKTPIFVTVAGDDQLGMMPMSINIYRKWFDAGQPAELHVYERGGHGFGMRTQNLPTDTWYDRFGDWLGMHGFLEAPAPAGPMQSVPTPNDTLRSVMKQDNGRLRFSFYAPLAQKVSVSGDFPGGFPALSLKKDVSGVWSATTDAAAPPEIYTYNFSVDGIPTLDPLNHDYKESRSGFSNIVEFPAPERAYQQWQEVPHGRVEKVWYTSSALDGTNRRLHVYLPPDYDALRKKAKLPVLYLLHGGGDNDASWTSAGRANTILDNLYAEGRLEPMIVVMPSGHTPVEGFFMGAGPEQDPFCRDFLSDIIPFVEARYPVSRKREDRAIAGLSMGGVQTLNLALWNPELFGYVFPMSTGYFPPTIQELKDKHQDVLRNQAINEFRQFRIYMGGEADIAYTNNINMMALFDEMGIRYQYENGAGGHTFLTWRRNLRDLAPLLFKH